eukprot:SAG31_NODE_1522_length_8012_cov_6.903336_3_plen_65_part_00
MCRMHGGDFTNRFDYHGLDLEVSATLDDILRILDSILDSTIRPLIALTCFSNLSLLVFDRLFVH